jgi:hypothetical protein
MPTQKEILLNNLHDTINKKAEKRMKNPLATPKSKPHSGKENKASKFIKSSTSGGKGVKKDKKAPSVL